MYKMVRCVIVGSNQTNILPLSEDIQIITITNNNLYCAWVLWNKA